MTALFGEAKGASMLTTYAVLDAAVNPFVPEILAATGLPHRSLYSGEAEAEYADSAPWLVQLDPMHRFSQSLFTKGDASWYLWGKGLGMLLRACAPFDDVRAHLRHFVKTQDANGKWYFFRFWEPATCAAFFETLDEDHQNFARWRRIGPEKYVTQIFAPMSDAGLLEIRFEAEEVDASAQGFVLREAEVHRMMTATGLQADLALAAFALQKGDPAPSDKEAALAFTRLVRTAAKDIGLTSITDQERLIRLSRLYGLDFQRDPRVVFPEVPSGPTEQMYAILDQRQSFADLLQGCHGQGGLDPAFLETDGNWSDFSAALQSDLSPDQAAAFYAQATQLETCLPRVKQVWFAFYLGHCFAVDPRYTSLLNSEVADDRTDPLTYMHWLCEAINNDPIARPI